MCRHDLVLSTPPSLAALGLTMMSSAHIMSHHAQEIFEGCLTRLESHGLVQLVLDCAVSLLEEGLLADSSISDLVDLVCTTPPTLNCQPFCT